MSDLQRDHRAPTTRTGLPRQHRITALDVVRGLALCGILVVNVPVIAHIGDRAVAPAAAGTGEMVIGLLAVHRFFPIFSLLFGVGFSLLLESAADRTTRPRVLLLRRLLALLAIGLLHRFLLWPGDILTVYAAVGLVVLLPSTWLPRWATCALAGVLTGAALLTGDGGITLVPGLFLLGSALVRYGVIDRIERSVRGPAIGCLLLALGAAPGLWAQAQLQGDASPGPGLRTVIAVSGLMLSGVYVCVLLILLHSPLRRLLHAVFAPLGRMALTNYLTATMAVLVIARLPGGGSDDWTVPAVLATAAAVLTVQWTWSNLWLRRFRYGPLEWLWRWATWLRRPALRRTD